MRTLKTYFDPHNSPGVLAAKLWISGGSRDDPSGRKGAHQLLSSLLSRGCGPYNDKALGDIVEGCGAGLHCETYEDGILISLKCMGSDAHKLFPILGWMIKDPHLNADHINLEKDLSIHALNRQRENPFYIAYDGWRRIAYGNGPYGHDPLGEIEDIKNINKDDLITLSKSIYKEKKILVISGALPQNLSEEIQYIEPFNDLTKEDSGDLSSQDNFLSNVIQPNKGGPTISLNFANTSQIVLMIGQPTVGYTNKDNLCLRLLNCHLSSGMSSKLFLELREKHGVAYDVGVYNPSREIGSPFVLHASTSEEKSLLTLDLLIKALRDLQQDLLSKEEISLAKTKYRSQISHSTQTVSQRAERKAYLLGMKLPINQDELNLKAIESITSNELLNVATKYLSTPLLSLCGPRKSLKKLTQKWDNYSL
ncbi:pitrilysin family protein [Prochlorococcus sp. MIT 1223]|uniref:M16 family metallopeptidase n=1 Tax=Prochlorococcus sp. MIT 1223 TaxID=3096217 RepID=UPI002A75212D|nr:pitrilysin family protein [Prochlorococcus sp. MIT 1223]